MNCAGGSSTGIPVLARGLRVLLVDHDTTSLLHVASVLERNTYKGKSTFYFMFFFLLS